MDKGEFYTNIANGFYAASKIKNMQIGASRKKAGLREESIPLISEVLQVIAEHSPHMYKNTLHHSASRTKIYGETYMNLREHLNNPESRRPDRHNFVRFIRILNPILNERQRIIADKIMKLYEIF